LSANRSIKILAVAGEASGDRLAARALKEAIHAAGSRGDSLELFGIGGKACEKIGMNCLYTVDEMSVVGFLEVAKRYGFFRNVLKKIIALLDSEDNRPDILFLVDYPGFNLRLAKEAHKRGIRVVFYVSPQVWAWKSSRIKDIVASVDDMIVIFPFETDLYVKAGLANTHFVGHPLLEIIEEERTAFISRDEFAAKFNLDPGKKWLLAFPGSRPEEVARHLDVMGKAATSFASKYNLKPVIVESESVPHVNYPLNSRMNNFRSAQDIHQLMSHSYIGILKSGTTTLEAALMGLPGVICYKTSAPTYMIAKRMIKLPFIGLANIVLGKKLYPELIQSEFTPDRIIEKLEMVMNQKEEFTRELQHVWDILCAPNGSPSQRAAEILLGYAQ
jgi:lipid-A-disaccharide synthase